MVAALLVLAALLVAAAVCLVRPTPVGAIALGALGAAWLPENNGHLEGAVLLAVAEYHGLTQADLLGYGGLALALVTWWRWRRKRLRADVRPGPAVSVPAMAAFVVLLVVMLGCGLLASWLQPDHRAWMDHVAHRGSALTSNARPSSVSRS